MANDFSSDSRFKALWRFESGALATDSKGSNTLTPHNSPAADTTHYKEGSASVSLPLDTLYNGTGGYLSIANGSLDAGFPGKSGDTTKKITALGWLYIPSFSASSYAIAGYANNALGESNQLSIQAANYTYMRLVVYYNMTEYQTTCRLYAGEWYHVALVVDGVNKSIYVRCYRASTDSVATYSATPAAEWNIGAALPWLFGGWNDYGGFGGINLDEWGVAADLLTSDEIDAVRNATYPDIQTTIYPSGIASAAAFGTATVEALPPSASFTPARGFALGGYSTFYDSRAASTAFAAGTDETFDGIMLGGDGSAYDSKPPEDFVAAGGFIFNGSGEYGQPSPTAFVAGGFMSFGGKCLLGTSVQTSKAFAADKGIQFGGKAAYGDGSDTSDDRNLVSAFAAAGGFKLGAMELSIVNVIYPEEIGYAFAASGGFEFGGLSGVERSAPPPVNDFAASGGVAFQSPSSVFFLYPRRSEFIAIGGFVLDAPGGQPDVFEAWSLSGQAFEPSMFSGFAFNSLAQHRGRTFAAGERGIYVLEGDNDDGTIIHPGIRIGPINFGDDQEERIRAIQFGAAGKNTRVRVDANGVIDIFMPERDENRVVCGRNMQAREFVIDIQDFLELSQLEFTILKMARR